MNLELPFEQVPASELDELFAAIDAAVDVLFLGAVSGAAEPTRAPADAPEAAA